MRRRCLHEGSDLYDWTEEVLTLILKFTINAEKRCSGTQVHEQNQPQRQARSWKGPGVHDMQNMRHTLPPLTTPMIRLVESRSERQLRFVEYALVITAPASERTIGLVHRKDFMRAETTIASFYAGEGMCIVGYGMHWMHGR